MAIGKRRKNYTLDWTKSQAALDLILPHTRSMSEMKRNVRLESSEDSILTSLSSPRISLNPSEFVISWHIYFLWIWMNHNLNRPQPPLSPNTAMIWGHSWQGAYEVMCARGEKWRETRLIVSFIRGKSHQLITFFLNKTYGFSGLFPFMSYERRIQKYIS